MGLINQLLKENKMKNMLIKTGLLISIIFLQFSASALFIEDFRGWLQSSSTSVICAENKKSYHWLENESATGYWGVHTDYHAGYAFHYFFLSEGAGKYNELQNKCISKFGEKFKYPQPADYSFSDWYPFAKNQNEMFPSAYVSKAYINFTKTYIPK